MKTRREERSQTYSSLGARPPQRIGDVSREAYRSRETSSIPCITDSLKRGFQFFQASAPRGHFQVKLCACSTGAGPRGEEGLAHERGPQVWASPMQHKGTVSSELWLFGVSTTWTPQDPSSSLPAGTQLRLCLGALGRSFLGQCSRPVKDILCSPFQGYSTADILRTEGPDHFSIGGRAEIYC